MGLLEYLQQGSPLDQTINKIGPGRIKTLQGEGGLLRKRYPEVYGALAGLLGTPPDKLEGSALDPNTARVKSGAEYTFPVGTAAQVLPIATKPLNALGAVIGKAAEPAVNRLVTATMERGGMPAQLLQDMAQGTQSPLTVWHGSPHKFDKFDASKIGTGEGAQAYGHGLYVAESPDVAKSYQTALASDRGFSFGGKSGLTRSEVQDMVNAKYGAGYLDGVLRPSGVADSFIDDMVTGLNRAEGSYPRQYKPGSQRAKVYDELRGQITHADPGSLYKVDLPDEHIARMLDWDKPLSEQHPDVQKALQTHGIGGGSAWDEITGHNLIAQLGQRIDPSNISVAASEALQKQGIPGIRYLDGGSRGTGAGTSNFVVFPGNEGLLTILERNGQPVNQLGGLLESKFTYPQEAALKLAQERAALPVEQGGLGLHPENTPMERAQKLGYTEDVYHATPEDFDAFKVGGKDPAISGHAIWTTPNAEYQPAAHNIRTRSGFRDGTQVMPLMARVERPLVVDGDTKEWAQQIFANGSKEFPEVMPKQWADEVRSGDEYRSIMLNHDKPQQAETIFFDPSHLRSRFAAFDPFRRNEPDLLAGLLPLSTVGDEDVRNNLLGLLGK